jgi:hypothetical protein
MCDDNKCSIKKNDDQREAISNQDDQVGSGIFKTSHADQAQEYGSEMVDFHLSDWECRHGYEIIQKILKIPNCIRSDQCTRAMIYIIAIIHLIIPDQVKSSHGKFPDVAVRYA